MPPPKYVERRQGDNISFDDVSVIPRIRRNISFQFLSTSLEQLVSLLVKGGKSNFVHTAKHLGTDDDIVFAKGVYPYSYILILTGQVRRNVSAAFRVIL